MPWQSLISRLDQLPLLLAGPIIRKTTPTSVSVWFALKESRDVTLNVYTSDVGNDPIFSGTAQRIGLGDRLFIYLATAKSNGPTFLTHGINYHYDLDFGNGDLLSNPTYREKVTYLDHRRPSFSLPPDDIEKVRIIHGSCRKPHGEGQDALEALNKMIQESNLDPTNRPHQLFLTGDQIYADDVADALLFMIDDAANVLMGWDETFNKIDPASLAPGERNRDDQLEEKFGLSAMISGKPENSKSHLLKFREYACMYLFAWSDLLWPETLPDNLTVWKLTPEEYFKKIGVSRLDTFIKEQHFLKAYQKAIGNIRRALANIPVYMIFDDHEVTDDWNLNWYWCQNLYSKPPGRKVIQNGLLSYAIFQGWGNTPEQFEVNNPGDQLIRALQVWRGQEDQNYKIITNLLSIPTIKDSDSPTDPVHNPDSLHWHYIVESSVYQVIVLDCRTMRNYPSTSKIEFAGLLSQSAFIEQLPGVGSIENEVVLVIAPTPVFGVPLIELGQRLSGIGESGRLNKDTEAWSFNEITVQRLLAQLTLRLRLTNGSRKGSYIILSGDVHYGFAERTELWGELLFEETGGPNPPSNVVFAQLTASSLKNQTTGETTKLHNVGYTIFDRLPKPIQEFGWKGTESEPKKIGRFLPSDQSVVQVDLNISNYLITFTKDLLQIMQVTNLEDPEWSTRTDFLLADVEIDKVPDNRNPKPTVVNVPPPSDDRTAALKNYLSLAEEHSEYTEEWGNGKEIVGVNNIGEISFEKERDDQGNVVAFFAVQNLWWQMKSQANSSELLEPFPLSKFKVLLNTNTNDFPKPTYP